MKKNTSKILKFSGNQLSLCNQQQAVFSIETACTPYTPLKILHKMCTFEWKTDNDIQFTHQKGSAKFTSLKFYRPRIQVWIITNLKANIRSKSAMSNPRSSRRFGAAQFRFSVQ